jgi:multidrug transporter EmrE-like cation transporter
MAKSKKSGDMFDHLLNSLNHKVWGFNLLPIFLGTLMATLDLIMMGTIKYVNQGKVSYGLGVPFAVGVYALEPLIFLKALNYEGLAVTNLIWNLVSDVLVTIQGVVFFGETVAGARWIAICMALVSLGIFAYTDKD